MDGCQLFQTISEARVRQARSEQVRILVHAEYCHPVGSAGVQRHGGVNIADRIGKGATPRDNEQAPLGGARAAKGPHDVIERIGDSKQAAADLDDGVSKARHEARACSRRSATAAAGAARCASAPCMAEKGVTVRPHWSAARSAMNDPTPAVTALVMEGFRASTWASACTVRFSCAVATWLAMAETAMSAGVSRSAHTARASRSRTNSRVAGRPSGVGTL